MNYKTPERYEGAKYDDLPQKIKEYVEKIAETKKGLYITGGVGVGKTHIAYAIKSGFNSSKVRVVNTPELLNVIRMDFNKRWADKELPEQELTDPEKRFLLILDDIGVEKPTDVVIETLYRIINARYNHKMPTIFTSNLSLAELADRIGDRSVSRISEMCEVVRITGQDKRLKK